MAQLLKILPPLYIFNDVLHHIKYRTNSTSVEALRSGMEDSLLDEEKEDRTPMAAERSNYVLGRGIGQLELVQFRLKQVRQLQCLRLLSG